MLINLLCLTLLMSLTFLSVFLIKRDYCSKERFIKGIAMFLLSYKAIDIIFGIIGGNYAKYPVEYSTIFYFFFPIVVLTNNKRLLGAATTGAFISGFAYLVTIVFNINNMLITHQNINNLPGFYLGMLSHSILYVLSLMIMAKEEFNYKKEVLIINLIAIIILVHADFMRNYIDFSEAYLFVHMLIDGVNNIPIFSTNKLLSILYFPAICGVYNLAILLFYRINHYLNEKHSEWNFKGINY